MSRKTKPSIQKPVFDEESILRFAAAEPAAGGIDQRGAAMDPEYGNICLRLKLDIIALLRAEASRKEKTIDQVVAKLVSKHLGRH